MMMNLGQSNSAEYDNHNAVCPQYLPSGQDGKGGQYEATCGQSLRNTGTIDDLGGDNVDEEEDNDDEGRQISAACAPQSSSSSPSSSSPSSPLSKQQVLHNIRKPGTVTVHFIQRPPSPTPLDTSRP